MGHIFTPHLNTIVWCSCHNHPVMDVFIAVAFSPKRLRRRRAVDKFWTSYMNVCMQLDRSMCGNGALSHFLRSCVTDKGEPVCGERRLCTWVVRINCFDDNDWRWGPNSLIHVEQLETGKQLKVQTKWYNIKLHQLISNKTKDHLLIWGLYFRFLANMPLTS